MTWRRLSGRKLKAKLPLRAENQESSKKLIKLQTSSQEKVKRESFEMSRSRGLQHFEKRAQVWLPKPAVWLKFSNSPEKLFKASKAQ